MNLSTYQQVYQILQDLLDKDIAPIYCKEKKGEVRHTQANISKARKMLDYSPRYSIKKGLDNYIQWYHKNTFYQ